MSRSALGAQRTPIGEDIGGNFERRRIPAQRDPRGGDFIRPQRRAVHIVAALLVGRALADHRAAGDQRGATIGLRGGERAFDIGEIMAVAACRVPT